MFDKSKYEELILKEIRALPDEALPKIARLISLIRVEFIAKQAPSDQTVRAVNHQRTRRLLATSKGNWAYDIIADREDRI